MADDTGGKARHLGGKIKEGIGDLLGDREMEREGQLDQVAGQAEQDQARAEEAQVEAIRRKAAAEEAKNRKPL
ncbi:MAG TPA: CsbD family protein [Longimicrobiaceae bacterium]|nr:CsbD family protein [Longimicrobiaceae bacterium]